MFEKIYDSLKHRVDFVQKIHDWLASRIDDVLAAFIKSKMSDLRSFANKLSDKFMLYVFSVGMTTILYCMSFFSTKFVWLSYSETNVGKHFIEGKSNAYMLTQGFFSNNSLLEIVSLSMYCAIFLLVVLSGTRLIFINRYFYECRSQMATSFLWGIPLAKFISLFHAGGGYKLTPFVDLKFILFLIPTMCILHPTMQFVNWLMPEAVEIYKNPAYLLRRLEVERAVHRINNHHNE